MRVRPGWALIPVLVFAPWASGCVKRSTYQAALGDLAEAHSVQDDLRAEVKRNEELEDSLRAEIADREQRIAQLQLRRDSLQAQLGSAAEEVHQLEVMVSQQGADYDQLQERLKSLSQVETEVQERNRIYEEMLGRFRSLIDAGQLNVSIVRGRMVIQLPQDVLFPSGSATLNSEGRQALGQVGSVLAELKDRSFQVEGHTDNVPISTAQFPSNWELSSARALSVVRVLIQAGVAPERLSGAGYGEYQPVASNDDAAGRRLNRRIEIVMLPNLDVIANTQINPDTTTN
jgi:chemotaxis protein MotB